MHGNWNDLAQVIELFKHFVVRLLPTKLLPKSLAPGTCRLQGITPKQYLRMLCEEVLRHVLDLQGSVIAF